MTNLRDYDRDAILIEKVRDLERQLTTAQQVMDRMRHAELHILNENARLSGLLRESLVKFEAYQLEGYLSAPINLVRRIREELEEPA